MGIKKQLADNGMKVVSWEEMMKREGAYVLLFNTVETPECPVPTVLSTSVVVLDNRVYSKWDGADVTDVFGKGIAPCKQDIICLGRLKGDSKECVRYIRKMYCPDRRVN